MSQQTDNLMNYGGSRVSRYARSILAVLVLAVLTAVICVTPALADFGIASVDGSVTNQDGTVDTQAGSHPYQLTTSFTLNSTAPSFGQAGLTPDGNVKDVNVDLPRGLVGNPAGLPQCPQEKLVVGGTIFSDCPAASQVGQLTLHTVLGDFGFSVYNMVAPAGEPAQFGAYVAVAPVFIDTHVRSSGDYGLSASLSDITSALPLTGSSLTLWGVPGDPSHDAQRGAVCVGDPTDPGNCSGGGQSVSGSPKAFLTLPSACAGAQATTVRADSWQNPGTFDSASFLGHDNAGAAVGGDGCNRLGFSPSISVQPDVRVADSASGLHVDVHVPQGGLEDPSGLAAANLKKAVVVLPEGMSVNPAAADGLASCSLDEIALSSAVVASCPDASKIGTVEVDTPLVDHPLQGGVFIAAQGANPFGSLLAVYIAVDDPQTGVVIKLAGHVVADPVTGQLTASFDNSPQLPFSDFKLDFFGGPRAALATPEGCGSFQSTSQLVPWSAVDPNNPTPGEIATPADSFTTSGGCVSGFAPGFTAGTVASEANGFSPFVLSVSRSDVDQELGGVSVRLPEGLLGMLSSVPLCGEPQASQGTCSSTSQVGHTVVAAGAGSSPLTVPQAGQPQAPVYLTGPYKGAPFGLSIVVPAVAGPFNLGTVVVRAQVSVDPHTSQVTVTSDPLPRILQGIPLRVRRVDVVVDRPGFIFNPTSCNPSSIEGTVTSTQSTES